jgi:hypothetical protein
MGEIVKWLMQDRQKDLFEILVALALNILFLALAALLLWPLDRLRLALDLAKGYGVLWMATGATAVLVHRVQSWFRVNLYDHPNAYVISNLAVSCVLQVGWSAFAALAVHGSVARVPVWVAVTLYAVGLLSCLIAYFAVSSVYQGTVYKMISLPVALAGFVVVVWWA